MANGKPMDTKIFSAKDYFNYYFAGITWLICALTTALKSSVDYTSTIEFIGKIHVAILIVLLLAIPFLTGFILSPAGNLITTLLRKIVGDPADWALVLAGQKFSTTKRPFQERISEPSRTKILEKLTLLQGGPAKYSPFYLVRNYVEIKANDNARTLVNRSLDMANLTESLLIPIPLLGFLIGEIFISQNGSLILGVLLFTLLCYRYIQLRQYWVKHNYRTFLILE
jgi:hypothetical protein